MPSLVYTPAIIALAGGSFSMEPVRFTYAPAATEIAPGAFDLSVAIGVPQYDVTYARLPRMQRGIGYFDKEGRPTAQMQQLWQGTVEAIEKALNALALNDTSQQGLIEQIQAALRIGTQAQQAVAAVTAKIDLANSYTEPTAVLSATSDGAVTISAHERVYESGARVVVDGGALSGFASGQFVRVYYDDAARSGGAVNYHGATTDIAQTGNRHVVGAVTIPAAGETANEGTGILPPGFVIELPAGIA